MVVPRVRVLDLLVPGAVRVVQEHEADGDGSDDEEDGVEELETPRRIFVVALHPYRAWKRPAVPGVGATPAVSARQGAAGAATRSS